MPAAMSKEAVVVMGPSQHGKSTFIKLAADLGDAHIATGDGSGRSCTGEPGLYPKTRIGLLMDTPGYNDTECRFNNTAAGLMVASLLIQHGITKVKFILVNSLVDMAQSLPQTLREFNLVFPDAMGSALVLATQVDKVMPQEDVPLKWDQLKKSCSKFGIATQMKWRSFKDPEQTPLDNIDLDTQFGNLNDRMTKLQPYAPKKAGYLEERIKQKMDDLQKEHGKVQEDQTQDVDEQYISEYESEDDVPVPNTVTEWEEVTDKVPVPRTEMEEIEEPCTAFTIPIIGIPIPGTQTRKVPVTKIEWEDVTKKSPHHHDCHRVGQAESQKAEGAHPNCFEDSGSRSGSAAREFQGGCEGDDLGRERKADQGPHQ